jgi:tetratricopeptide (TPR) repeat protein
VNYETFISIEIAFEQGTSHCESGICTQDYLNYFQLITINDYVGFYSLIGRRLEGLKTQSNSEFEQGCCLIWLIQASESQFNLPLRDQYLAQFHKIADQNHIGLFEYYRQYFRAVTYAFESLQVEALAWYQKSLSFAEMANYPRGAVRSLIGIGLTNLEMNNNDEAKQYLKAALELASHLDLKRCVNKINYYLAGQRLNQMSPETDFLVLREEIKVLILENDLLFARQKLVKAEVLRRKANLNRKAHSFYVLYAVICGLLGKHFICRNIIGQISDRVLKLEALSLLKNLDYKFDNLMLNSIKFLEAEIYAVSKTQTIELSEIKNTNVRSLLRILSSSMEPMNKAVLFESVFNLKYDPTIHDAKLYKLIMLTRKLVSSDVIVNHHGAYSCNIKRFKFIV